MVEELELTTGKENKYTSPLTVNNQLYFCGIPFRMDTYNGCSHACKYCFVRAQELTSASRKNRGSLIMAARGDLIRNMLHNAIYNPTMERADITIEWLRQRMPIHWGGMSDPFQACERQYGISKRWLWSLGYYDYPTVISTKGIMLMEPEYLELVKKGKFAVQVSCITDDDEFLLKLEPGTPKASERLKLLEVLANNEVWTAVRIQPMIPNTVVERELPRYLKHLHEIGVKHVLIEGFKAPVKNPVGLKQIWEICPDALREYQYNDVSSKGFEKHLPTRRKWQYVKVAIEILHQYGMTYGAADNDLRDMGDVVTCCGIDNIPGFGNYWKYQASQAAMIAKEKGWVGIEDMQGFWHGEKEFSVHNETIRDIVDRTGASCTPKFIVDTMWEKGGENSPECMYSMKRATRDGKLVYEWRDARKELEDSHAVQGSMF